MLVEENMEDKLCLFYDPSVLPATEKSLHEFSDKHPALPNQTSKFGCQNALSTSVLFPRTGHNCGDSNGTGNIGCADNSREKETLVNNRENRGSLVLVFPSGECSYQSTDLPAPPPSSDHPKGLADYVNQILASPINEFPVQYDSLRASQCKRGLEEACKFLSGDNADIDATENGIMSVAMKKRGLKAISIGDSEIVCDLLRQIRLHSSPVGDACQRLAHVFANGLDARLAGISVQNVFTNLTLKRAPISELLKPHRTHYKAFPFTKIVNSFADNMILKVAGTTKTLHVIDFGILLGCQWPLLIQLPSRRPRGPPKLRLMGIELPQHGFKPEERIVKAGRHLAKYCEQLAVPSEYNAMVSQQWETIEIEELKIHRNEVLAVNCRYQFENVLDETAVENNPMHAVLKLIRELRPDIFVLSVVNGTYNSPYFVPRFRQALFHFSTLFNIFDCNVPPDDIDRINIEREYYRRQVMNIIACEGKERVERPETYKQWQKRVSQAGFKQRPLDKALMKIYMDKVKSVYQKDLMILKDGNWMLRGWKGRILHASCSWEPT